MIQRTAFKALLEHKGQLLLLGLTCLIILYFQRIPYMMKGILLSI